MTKEKEKILLEIEQILKDIKNLVKDGGNDVLSLQVIENFLSKIMIYDNMRCVIDLKKMKLEAKAEELEKEFVRETEKLINKE